jgi:hypothetical protein
MEVRLFIYQNPVVSTYLQLIIVIEIVIHICCKVRLSHKKLPVIIAWVPRAKGHLSPHAEPKTGLKASDITKIRYFEWL